MEYMVEVKGTMPSTSPLYHRIDKLSNFRHAHIDFRRREEEQEGKEELQIFFLKKKKSSKHKGKDYYNFSTTIV